MIPRPDISAYMNGQAVHEGVGSDGRPFARMGRIIVPFDEGEKPVIIATRLHMQAQRSFSIAEARATPQEKRGG